MLSAKSVGASGFSLFTATPSASRAERWLQEQFRRARREGPFTITAELTPELAELLLGNNPANRKISPKVATYANDIKAGRWLHNGETVIVADTGELNDGQHRCAAVVAAGKSLITEMTFGIARDTRTTIDSGIKRTVGQQLGMLGKTDVNHRAHAVNLILTYERTGRLTKATYDQRPTQSEIIEWEMAHDITEDTRIGGVMASKFKISGGLVGALHWVLSMVHANDATHFFATLKTGTVNGMGLPAGSPIFKLREALLNAKGSKKRLSDTEIAGLCFMAWNAYRAKRSIRALKFDPASALPRPE